VIATLTGVIGIGGIWANRQLLDTGSWVSTSDRMLHNQEIRHRVAQFLTEELVAHVRDQVQSAGSELSGAEEAQLEARVPELTERALATHRIETVWRRANRFAHESLLRILNEESARRGGQRVVLNLDPALRYLASELKYGELQASAPPPGAGRIEVVRESELETAQTVVGVIRHVPLIAAVILVVLYALALLLASRLWRGFAGIGLSLLTIGALTLIVRSIAGKQIIDALVEDRSVRGAADAAWGVATSTVVTWSVWAIVIGAVVALIAWLLGDSGPALALRRNLGLLGTRRSRLS
jgi:hypothetical protein